MYVRYNCAKFLYCKICATDFIKEGFFRPPIHEQQQNGPSGIGTRSLLDFSDKQESFLYISNNTVYDYLLVKCGSFHLFLISHNRGDHAPNFFLVAKPETISIILHDIRAKILVVIQKISLTKSLKRVWLKK